MGEVAQISIEVVPHGRRDEVLDARGVEARQRDPCGGIRAAQLGQERLERVGHLGHRVTEGRQQQERHLGAGSGQVPEERKRLMSGPVQVVDQHHHRSSRCCQSEHGVHCGEEAVPLGVGVGGGRVFDSRDPTFDLWQEHGDLRELLTVVFEQFVGHRPQQVVEYEDERLVRHGQLGVTGAIRDGSAPTAGPPSEFGGEPGLAGTGFTAEEHRVAGSAADGRPRLEQRLPLTRPTDEGRTALRGDRRRQCDGERLGRRRQLDRAPFDLVRVDRLGQTLQRQRVECSEVRSRPVTGELTHERAHHDLAGRRRRLEASRHHDRQAVAVAVLPADVTDPQPDPQS